MDPISAIFVMAVLGGLFVRGVDVATDGLLSAEVGGGVRGAGGYAVRAGKARWRLANAKAREIRMQSPQGRKVQELLDLAGVFVRVLSAEAVRFGSGARSGWETGRDQARSARTKRRGDAPWPVTEWAHARLVRLQEARTKTPNGNPNDPNGEPEQSWFATAENPEWYRATITTRRFGWADVRVDYLGNRTDAPQLLATFDDGYGVAGATRAATTFMAEHHARCSSGAYRTEWVVDGGDPVDRPPVTPYASDDLGPLPPKCPGCGMPLVIGSLSDHRMGLDRCPYATDPNGDPNVPLESTVPDENGNVRCGCCAQLHKPLEPGEHCPHCHIHDHPSQNPTGPIPNAPAMRGPSMDINSAPTAIAAAEAFAPRFESLQSRADSLAAEWDSLKNDADTLHGEIATLMDGMGDFAIGGEADTAASVGELSESTTSAKEQADNVVTSLTTAKEAHAAYVDNLHLEYDASIEAAAGKAADAHAVMQEA